MALQATVIAFDGKSTPVQHVFAPESNDVEGKGFNALWREAGLTTLPHSAQPTLAVSESVLRSGVKPVVIKIKVPRLEAATGGTQDGYTAAPKVAFFDEMFLVYNRHPRATSDNAKEVYQLFCNIMTGSTSNATPVTTGTAAYDMVVNGLKPY